MKDLKEVNEQIQVNVPYRVSLLESQVPNKYKAAVMQKLNILKSMEPSDNEYYKIKNFLANQKLFLALIIQEQNAMNELYQYSNIDFLCLPEGLNKNLHQTDQILRTAQSEILVVSDSECRWRHNEYSQIPRFSNKLDNSLGYDLPSLLLSILAPLRAIKINPEWLELIGNALITLLAEKNRSIDIFDKTVFEKFIIALLNR